MVTLTPSRGSPPGEKREGLNKRPKLGGQRHGILDGSPTRAASYRAARKSEERPRPLHQVLDMGSGTSPKLRDSYVVSGEAEQEGCRFDQRDRSGRAAPQGSGGCGQGWSRGCYVSS